MSQKGKKLTGMDGKDTWMCSEKDTRVKEKGHGKKDINPNTTKAKEKETANREPKEKEVERIPYSGENATTAVSWDTRHPGAQKKEKGSKGTATRVV